MNIREDVIYARQSVDRKDSISIESQIDFCKYELKGGSCRVFKDKGAGGYLDPSHCSPGGAAALHHFLQAFF